MPSARSAARAFALVVASLFATGSAVAASTAPPQVLPYTVSVVAGGATASPAAGASCGTGSTLTSTDAAGDGCLATQVLLSVPRAVAADSQGNVYVVDSANVSIRRVDARSGIISTVAGGAAATPASGAACGTGSTLTATNSLGDGCLGTQVKLVSPEGITVDAQDNVWFTDFTQSTVRTVSRTTGIITTIVNTAGTLGYRAGNVANPGVVVPAAQGMLQKPYGLTFDNAGNLYIADNYNNVVDVVNLSAATVTVAGNAIPAGAIFTIAGSGCAYGTTGCSSAYGKTNGTTSTGGLLDSPYQVAVDNAGNIYIADEYPYDVRVINTAGVMSTYANAAMTKSAAITRGPAVSTSLASTFGVATDAAGDLYISVYDTTTGSSYIDRVDAATGIIYAVGGQQSTAVPTAGATPAGVTNCSAKTDNVGDGCPGTQASFYKPYQPFVDAAGTVYIADQGNNLIRKLSVGTQFSAAGQATGTSSSQTVQIHLGAGDTLASAAITAGVDFTIATPTCAAANSDTTTDCAAAVTFKPSAPGIRTGAFTVKSSSGLVGTFAVTGTGLGAVLALDPGTQATLASGVTAVAGITVGGGGNTFAAVPGSGSIQKYSPAGALTTVGTGLSTAAAVAVDPYGNVFAALSSGSVVEVPANGAAQTTIGSGFQKPSGIAADAFGNVYVADSSASQVVEINSKTGVQRVLATAASAGLSAPAGLAVDAVGNVYVANAVGNNVIELPFRSATALTLGSGLQAPSAVALDAAGSLYVADTRNGRVVLIPNEAGKLNTSDQITVVSGLTAPSGIAVSGSAQVTVSDSSLNAIYTYTRTGSTLAFGNDPIGTQLTASADLVSAGNLPVTLGSTYFTASGNTADFNLTPSTLNSGTTLAAGYVAALTAGFKPTAAGSRAAAFTFTSSNATGPVLSVTGTGITPTNATSTTITAAPTAGTYGQTVTATFTVATGTSAVPTGTLNVKVDTTAYTPTLTGGTVTLQFAGLSAGSHTITASYPGDANSSPSTASPVTITLAKAPLTIVVNSATKAYGAPLPTFTGTVSGAVNNDQIGVTYSTTATQTSALGQYPINAATTGSALTNYSVTTTPGTLTITQAGTTITLAASSTAVSSTTAVTLTATVVSATTGTPTGTVTFFNNGTALQGAVTLSAAGTASITTTFAVTGQSSSNVITAVYSGSTNFAAGTSAAVTVVSSLPGFNLSNPPTTLTVQRGQTGLATFTLTPTFGFAGNIGFACTGLPATVGCTFSPTSVTADGTNTASLITVGITTVQPGNLASLHAPPVPEQRGRGLAPFALAGLPGVLLLAGLARRKAFHALRSTKLYVFAGLVSVLLLGAAGCGSARSTAGTPAGTYAITVVASGTSSTGTTAITQQFVINLTVQ